jgi:hypothetical protein
MNRTLPALALAIALAFVPGPARAGDMSDASIYKAKMSFADVKQNIADGIINRGYRIDYTGHIGDMLKRTASDVGATGTIYADAEIVQFCSAVLSRKMMEIDPANIVYCPFVIFYYERADQPGIVYAGHRHMGPGVSSESKAATDAINKLLDDIVREATEAN